MQCCADTTSWKVEIELILGYGNGYEPPLSGLVTQSAEQR